VNARRLLAGYHMDWGSSFPFEAVDLPDNYARRLPSIALFGFQYYAGFTRAAGPRVSQARVLAEAEQAKRAEAAD
jgi:hypothetical protein